MPPAHHGDRRVGGPEEPQPLGLRRRAEERAGKPRRLVVLGFLSEIVQRIGEPELEARLLEALVVELEAAR